MSLVPIVAAAGLVLATVILVRIQGLPPLLTGAVVGGGALLVLFLLTGAALAVLPKGSRSSFLNSVWFVIRRDMKDLLDLLIFRK